MRPLAAACLALVAGCGGTAAGGGDPLGGDGGTPGFVTASGTDLALDGRRFRFVGANRYDLASFPPGSGKYYCGGAWSDAALDALLDELATRAGASVVRLWAFQAFALGGADFSSLDRVVATAARHHLKLILTLENEWQDCTEPDPGGDGGRKSAAWFGGGFRTPLGAQKLSFRDWTAAVVARYRDEPTVAMWQLMNEAESPDESALLAFAGEMAALVKSIDPRHLVSLGTIGGGQAGTSGGAFRALHEIATIDVVEAHDYQHEREALPGAPTASANTLFSALRDAAAVAKPFFVGEAGIAAPTPDYAFSYDERARLMDAKIAAEWAAGSDGFLVWSARASMPGAAMGWDFDGADPLAAVLARRAAEAP